MVAMPGYNLTQGNRLSRMLMADNTNNGTTAGGLGHVLGRGLAGMLMADDRRRSDLERAQYSEAVRAAAGGMQAKPWNIPDASISAGPSGSPGGDVIIPRDVAMGSASPVGGYAGALSALGGVDPSNPFVGRLTMDLLAKQMDREEQRRSKDSELMQVYDPTAGAMVYRPRGEVVSGSIASAPPEQFETVDNPFGRGGVGQRSTANGRIVAYQGPSGPGRSMWAYDREAGSVALVPESEVMANPGRFTNPAGAPDPADDFRTVTLWRDGSGRTLERGSPEHREMIAAGWIEQRSDPLAGFLGMVDPSKLADKPTMEAGAETESPGLFDRAWNAVTEWGQPEPSAPVAGSAGAPGPGSAPRSDDLSSDDAATLAEARAAIARNPAARAEVERRLRDAGIDPGLLGAR